LKFIACIDDRDISNRFLPHLLEKKNDAPARPVGAGNEGATWDFASFRWEEIQSNST